MRLQIGLLFGLVSVAPALAEKMPVLPPTAVSIPSGTMQRQWAPGLWLRSELYKDRVGETNVFYEVYYLKEGTRPVRMTLRETYGEEMVIWVAPGFEAP